MKKITYTRQGDYNLPNLKLPEQESRVIGIWGQRRKRYLREHHKILYYNLLTCIFRPDKAACTRK